MMLKGYYTERANIDIGSYKPLEGTKELKESKESTDP